VATKQSGLIFNGQDSFKVSTKKPGLLHKVKNNKKRKNKIFGTMRTGRKCSLGWLQTVEKVYTGIFCGLFGSERKAQVLHIGDFLYVLGASS
jgi:hypothetical protein